MSIILDALRKSEAARRRNEAPELFAPMPTAAAPTRARARWPLWAFAGVGIATLALAFWLWSRRDASMASPASAEGPTNAQTPASEPLANAPPQTATNDEISDPAPASGSAPTVSVPTPSPAPVPPRTIPVPPIASAPLPAPSTNPAIVTDTRSSNAVASSPRENNVTAPAAPSPAEPTPSPTTFRSPQSDAPLALADLDPGTRKELPPLKLSMHVWNDTPSQRFVILDGQRLREGDVLGNVVVERITRDGATLSWRGTALKLEWR